MTDRDAYYERSASWADDTRLEAARSRRAAWTIAGIAVAVALFEAVALAMLLPLKTVQPITLLVDRHTGYVQAIDPITPRRVGADEALTRSLLAQYVSAREQFDRATVQADYRRVALWSAGRTRQIYVAEMPATNPASPFQRYPAGTMVRTTIKSISPLERGIALVRFDTQLQDRSGRVGLAQPWISTVRYGYTEAPMRFEDRLVNPLGFQVVGYRRDAEAPPPVTVLEPVRQTLIPPPASASIVTTTTVVNEVPRASVRRRPTVPDNTAPRLTPRASPRPTRSEPAGRPAERREVPYSNVPLGSPLSPGGGSLALDTSRPLR